MKTVKGDLLDMAKNGKFDVIVHGANCFHTMGAGIAKQIKEQFPKAYEADCKCSEKGNIEKLGTFTLAYVDEYDFVILNAYTQFNTGADVDYKAIRKAFRLIYQLFGLSHVSLGYPKIGAGIAGGDWDIISKIIDEELKDMDHTLVEYETGK